jgi:hypothetical protein
MVRNILIHDEQLRLIAKAVRTHRNMCTPEELAKPCMGFSTIGETLKSLEEMCNMAADSGDRKDMVYGFAL